MDLGLESINANQQIVVCSAEELMNDIVDFMNSSNEALSYGNQFMDLCRHIDNLQELSDTIAEYGYTKSIDKLFGSNFPNGYSHESIGSAIKAGWDAFVKWLKELFMKIKAVWAYFFTSADKMISKLEARKKEIESKGVREGTQVKIPGMTILSNLYKVYKDKILPCVNQAKEFYKMVGEMCPVEKAKTAFELVDKEIDLTVEALENTDKKDTITLTKQFAVSYIGIVLDIFKLLKTAKSFVDNFEAEAQKLINALNKHSSAVGKIAEHATGAPSNIVEQGAKVAGAILDSPLGKQLISKLSTKMNMIMNKATREAVAIGSITLSVIKSAKADGDQAVNGNNLNN